MHLKGLTEVCGIVCGPSPKAMRRLWLLLAYVMEVKSPQGQIL